MTLDDLLGPRGEPRWSERGLFVVLEGGDGAGKTTQSRVLMEWLANRGVTALTTYEPGDSAVGQQIRRIVLDPAGGEVDHRAEALLYAADKAQHLYEVVEPALARGEVVVCDRYVDSMLAYQGAGRALSLAEVEQVARWATGNLRPHLTVLLDVDPEQAVSRKRDPDRVEGAGAQFHGRVRQYLLDLAAADPEHYLVLPARGGRVEEIAASIRSRLELLVSGLSAPAATMGP